MRSERDRKSELQEKRATVPAVNGRLGPLTLPQRTAATNSCLRAGMGIPHPDRSRRRILCGELHQAALGGQRTPPYPPRPPPHGTALLRRSPSRGGPRRRPLESQPRSALTRGRPRHSLRLAHRAQPRRRPAERPLGPRCATRSTDPPPGGALRFFHGAVRGILFRKVKGALKWLIICHVICVLYVTY